MKNKIKDSLRIVSLALVLSATIGYSFAAFVAPTSAPPDENTPPPINVGTATQTKNGNLFVNGTFASTAGVFNSLGVYGNAGITGNLGIVGKATSANTVDSDSPVTLTTKGYVDGKLAAITAGGAGGGGGAVFTPQTSFTNYGPKTGSWADVNNSGHGWFVTAWGGNVGNPCQLVGTVNGVTVARQNDQNNAYAKSCFIAFVVPPGQSFVITSLPYGGGSGKFNATKTWLW